jgi:hypothetical protein
VGKPAGPTVKEEEEEEEEEEGKMKQPLYTTALKMKVAYLSKCQCQFIIL